MNQKALDKLSVSETRNIRVFIKDFPKIVLGNLSIDDLVLLSIRRKIEGKCDFNHNGLVIKNTTSILSRSIGNYIFESFKGYPTYRIRYTTKVLHPAKGTIIPCRIKIKNKIGIIAHFDIKNTTYIRVLVPYQLTNRGTDSYSQQKLIDSISVNSDLTLHVQVIETRFEMNDTYVTVIGNITENIIEERKIENKNPEQSLQGQHLQVIG